MLYVTTWNAMIKLMKKNNKDRMDDFKKVFK